MTLDLSALVFGLGFLCVVEGLVIALAPRRLDEMLALLARLTIDTRRRIGLILLAAGVLLIWLAGA
ncbi:MAG: DUF2065 domain-containing protein [Paracoccaceae bacterium]